MGCESIEGLQLAIQALEKLAVDLEATAEEIGLRWNGGPTEELI